MYISINRSIARSRRSEAPAPGAVIPAEAPEDPAVRVGVAAVQSESVGRFARSTQSDWLAQRAPIDGAAVALAAEIMNSSSRTAENAAELVMAERKDLEQVRADEESVNQSSSDHVVIDDVAAESTSIN